ncbi:MAG TPA: choice-of-anchor D domain-containing protein [Bryobacteraceae bacterium]|nr:choice-of-anchor D domain-containing protein [Bryobacteraceae bacterium]
MRRIFLLAWLCAAIVPLARAQFAFSLVNGSGVTPLGSTYSFGNVPPGVTVSVSLQIQNTSAAAAKLSLLALDGPPAFTISSAPAVGTVFNPQQTATFTVSFAANVNGGYSAFLLADGVTAILTAAVVPGLSYQVATAAGMQNLGAAPAIDFGTVGLGATGTVQFTATNRTAQPLKVPAISVTGSDFSLLDNSISGATVQPGAQITFSVQFQPSAAGTRSGTITIGTNSYALTGTGVVATMPQPHVNILLSQAQSAQQGTVTVTFDSPAAIGGSGSLALAFQPAVPGAVDSAVAFASGGQSIPFTFAAGDVQASFGGSHSAGFQTGTTAGSIQFTAQIGSQSDQQAVTIAPATVSFTGIEANRYSGSVVVQITGYDNTRSAGPLSFAFYDAAGNTIAPGAISVNATAAFAQYFSTSQGGGFSLSATFPVTGDASEITYVQAAFSNSAGISTTAKTSLQ